MRKFFKIMFINIEISMKKFLKNFIKSNLTMNKLYDKI